MPSDTWFSRDLPVLEAAVELLDEQMQPIQPQEVAKRIGMPLEDVSRALTALDGAYVDMNWLQRQAGIGRIRSVTPAARQATGQWPSPESITDRFLQTLDERIEGSPNEAERSRWVKMRDAVGGAGRDLFVDVLGAAISKQVTGGG